MKPGGGFVGWRQTVANPLDQSIIAPAGAETLRGRRLFWLLGLLGALCLIPGLAGRDPWKADEAYSFGMVLEMLQRGDWVVPTLGGEPFMEKPPVLYATAAACARVCSWALPLHDGARLAVLLFNGITLAALGFAVRELWGMRRWWLGPVLFLGTLGPMHNQHMLITDVALLTGFALGHAGLALSLRRPAWGGVLLGTGAGVAFMAKGLLGPGLMGVMAVALPVVFKAWRTRGYARALGVAALSGLPWVLVWPGLLYHRSPELFREWFWVNNIGRFMGSNTLGPKHKAFFYFRLLPWFALPVLPLALWAWVRGFKKALPVEGAPARPGGLAADPSLQLPLVSFLVMLGVLSLSADGRSLYAQPMIVPLALAAAPAAEWVRGRLARGVGAALLGLALALAAGGWVFWGLITAGVPASLGGWIQAKIPQYAPGLNGLALCGGVAATAAALVCWRGFRGGLGPELAARWTIVTGFGYALGMTLFMPLVNANMTYRGTFGELRERLPVARGQVASIGLGEPQRGLLHYYAGLRTRRVEAAPEALDTCDLMVVQGNYRDNYLMGPPPRGAWRLLWEGRRGGRESFRLYQRLVPEYAPVPKGL